MSHTESEFKAKYHAATLKGAAEGIIGGLAFAIPTSLILHNRWAYYRTLPIQLKAFGVVLVVGPAYAVQAQRRALQFEKSNWHDVGKMSLEDLETRKRARWDSMTMREKVGDWAFRNQYRLIMASWALGMGVATALTFREKNETPSQKIVQIRMYAQGITIGIMVCAGILTHSQREAASLHSHEDHSWALILQEQEKQQKSSRS